MDQLRTDCVHSIEPLCRSSSPHTLEIGDWKTTLENVVESCEDLPEKIYPLLTEEDVYISSPTSSTTLKDVLLNECISSTTLFASKTSTATINVPNESSPPYDAKRALELLEEAALKIKTSSSSSSITATTTTNASATNEQKQHHHQQQQPSKFLKRIPLQDITNTNRTISIMNGKLRHPQPSQPPILQHHHHQQQLHKEESIRFMEPKHSLDLYSPRWVRGKGFTREGLCHFCHLQIMASPTKEDSLLVLKNSTSFPTETQQGNWYRIKQSAFWYHLHFHHGISAKRGERYPPIEEASLRLLPVLSKYGIPNEHLKKAQVHCRCCEEYITVWQQKSSNALPFKPDLLGTLPVLQNWWKHCQRRHQ